MNRGRVVSETAAYVRSKLEGDSTGHDWWHIYRVWKTALYLAKREKGADMFTVQLAALLHDIADYKLHGGDTNIGPDTARRWLISQGVDKKSIGKITRIINEIAFKGAKVKSIPTTIEGKIIQDADRLDAIGAIGIGRAFAFGGKMNREMHNPEIRAMMHRSFRAYKNSKSTTINHFSEKLLLLKGLMNTKAGKNLAKERDEFMRQYLNRFFKEWNGKA